MIVDNASMQVSFLLFSLLRTHLNLMWLSLLTFMGVFWLTFVLELQEKSVWLLVHLLEKIMLYFLELCLEQVLEWLARTRWTQHQWYWVQWWCWDIWISRTLLTPSESQWRRFWTREKFELVTLVGAQQQLNSQRR